MVPTHSRSEGSACDNIGVICGSVVSYAAPLPVAVAVLGFTVYAAGSDSSG